MHVLPSLLVAFALLVPAAAGPQGRAPGDSPDGDAPTTFPAGAPHASAATSAQPPPTFAPGDFSAALLETGPRPEGDSPLGVASWEDSASIVDLAGGTEVAVVAVGDQSGVVDVTPDGLPAVVGNAVDQSGSSEGYVEQLERQTGQKWTSEVDTYTQWWRHW